jgi:hypothetical protein
VSRHHPLHVTLRFEKRLPSLRRPRTLQLMLRVFEAIGVHAGFRLVRLARRLNAHWRRRGRVLADRYHERALRSPREVRAALVYVLANARHHGSVYAGYDGYTSGAWFDGWRGIPSVPHVARAPVRRAVSWLLRVGWRRYGLVRLDEAPRPG